MIRHRLPETWLPLYDGLRFELRQTVGRWRQPREIDCSGYPDYLHLGCGSKILEGFLNTDVFGNERADIAVDLRYPLPLAEKTFSGIYSHHVVEHLSYDHAHSLFSECHRLLKPGGRFRVVVPDVGKFVAAYAQSPSAMFDWLPEHLTPEDCETSIELIDHLVRGIPFNEHRSSWDAETLERRLLAAGFKRFSLCSVGQSSDPKLSGLDAVSWAAHSIYVEAEA